MEMRHRRLAIAADTDQDKTKETKIRKGVFLVMMSIQYGLGMRQDTHHIHSNRQSPSMNA